MIGWFYDTFLCEILWFLWLLVACVYWKSKESFWYNFRAHFEVQLLCLLKKKQQTNKQNVLWRRCTHTTLHTVRKLTSCVKIYNKINFFRSTHKLTWRLFSDLRNNSESGISKFPTSTVYMGNCQNVWTQDCYARQIMCYIFPLSNKICKKKINFLKQIV